MLIESLKMLPFRPFLILLLTATLTTAADQPGQPAAKPKPFTISEKTTRLVEPVHSDGYIDYVAVLNSEGLERVPPVKNFAIPLLCVDRESDLSAFLWSEDTWGQIFKLIASHEAALPENVPTYHMPLHGEGIKVPYPVALGLFNEVGRAECLPWTEEQFPFAAKYVRENLGVLEFLQTELNRSDYFNPLVSPFIAESHRQESFHRTFRELLSTTAYLELGKGNFNASRKWIVALFQLAERLKNGLAQDELREATFAESLAGQISRDYILDPRAKSEDIKLLLAEIGQFGTPIDLSGFVDSVYRFRILQILQLRALGIMNKEYAELMGDKLPEFSIEKKVNLERVDWDVALEQANVLLDETVDAWSQPVGPKLRAALQELDDRRHGPKVLEEYKKRLAFAASERLLPHGEIDPRNGRLIGDLVVVADLHKLHQRWDCGLFSRQFLDLVLVTGAIRLYEIEHGRLPRDLQQLATHFPSIPRTSICGSPLVYNLRKESFSLYAVGLNGKDEDGEGQFRHAPWENGPDDVSVWVDTKTAPEKTIFRKGELPFERKESSR
ncbi:hypothetical protein [Rubinisphaera margarita]|uniref:hypothetical protein n=1 Tax=Rubinisphaera margarita TaxID=2909586 RepID=UPI001EE80756|nr:hypothetical protein [Rubinisphaera margarita]MCG6157669.1 hypothetical protein [Rubinisphaera margarita]